MKNKVTTILLFIILLGLQSCVKKSSESSNSDFKNTAKKDISINHQNLNENYDHRDFQEFYGQLKKSLSNRSELVKFCDFPFNETISKEEFSQNNLISEEVKNLILKVFPEKSGEKYIIDNDSFYIQIERNKEGNWKLKSIETSY